MRPIQHSSNNLIMKPPDGMTKEQCVALPITRILYKPEGVPAMLSFWEVDDKDIEGLLTGRGVIVLEVMGTEHPPVNLRVALKDMPIG